MYIGVSMDTTHYAEKNSSPTALQLEEFVRSSGCLVGKGNKATNVIDMALKRTFVFDEDNLCRFLYFLENCRRAGVCQHYMERQQTETVHKSGIMIDFDLLLDRDVFALDDRTCHRMVILLIQILGKHLVLNADREYKWHFFFIVRPKSTPLRDSEGRLAGYKHGLHILIPGVRTTRHYKKFLISQIRQSAAFMSLLSALGVVGSPGSRTLEDCVDFGSSSVPVLFLGSCKTTGLLYELRSTLEFVGTKADFETPMLRQIPPSDDHNLVYEMALCARPPAEKMYKDARMALVDVEDFNPNAALLTTIETFSARTANGQTMADEIRQTDRELDSLTSEDPEAQYLRDLLEILPAEYATDYHLWRNVIFALANTSPTYFVLAVWFSQRCAAQWAKGGREALQTIWDNATDPSRDSGPRLTKKSIVFWAKKADPDKFREVSGKCHHNLLSQMAFEHGGRLGHSHFARLLKSMLGDRFVTDTVRSSNLRNEIPAWYEFVTGGLSPHLVRPGEVWKWKREAVPVGLHLYLANEIVALGGEVLDTMRARKEAAQDENHTRYYKDLIKKFSASIASLSSDPCQRSIVRQSVFTFMRAGFADILDQDPYVRGVGNGVLCIKGPGRPKSILIKGYHEYPVMKFTPTMYREFDPEEPCTKLLLGMLKKIFPEVDARVKLLMHQSMGLKMGLKDPWIPMLMGTGSNGKTSMLEFGVNALGSEFAVPLPMSLLTEGDRTGGQSCNAAIARMDGKSLVYFDETSARQVLSNAGLKMVVNTGKISNNAKFQDQKEIRNTQTCAMASNFDLIVPTKDHGTWRRIGYYNAKAKFCPDPDPSNPYEHLEDPRFATDYVTDPEFHSAYLSILVHFWDRLQDEYDGRLRAVPSPTIDSETETYRVSQDRLHRFIVERVVRSPGSQFRYTMASVAEAYSTWYSSNIEYKKYVVSDLIQDIMNSVLKKFMQTNENTERVLTGCRIIEVGDSNPGLSPGESWIGARKGGSQHTPVHGPERPDWWNWSPQESLPKELINDAVAEVEAEDSVFVEESDYIPPPPRPKSPDSAFDSMRSGCEIVIDI